VTSPESHADNPSNGEQSGANLVLPEGGGDSPLFVCRIALALLRMPDGTHPLFTSPESAALGAKVESDLRRALNDDSRISELIEESDHRSTDNALTLTFYDPDTETISLKSEDEDRFQAMRLNTLLTFRLQVPPKNQPRYRSADDVPTDAYTVAWNGVMAAVQWSQASARATLSGGHVALEVLGEVALAAGYELKILPCDPSCLHQFVHADIVTFDNPDFPSRFRVTGESTTGETIVTPFRRKADDLKNLRSTFAALYTCVELYAETKTIADRISDLESAARDSAAQLMLINYRSASRARLPRLKAVRDLWEMRGGRRQAQTS
jgi:hypothetical protein